MDASMRSDTLAETGCWHAFSFSEKREWLNEVRLRHCGLTRVKGDEVNGSYEIDGSFIRDYPSFFLAIGEAVNGAGGYFGGCLDALDDCCLGGFGAVAPFTLLWRDHQESRNALTKEAWMRELAARGEHSEAYLSSDLFDAIVEVLEERGVKLILQ